MSGGVGLVRDEVVEMNVWTYFDTRVRVCALCVLAWLVAFREELFARVDGGRVTDTSTHVHARAHLPAQIHM